MKPAQMVTPVQSKARKMMKAVLNCQRQGLKAACGITMTVIFRSRKSLKPLLKFIGVQGTASDVITDGEPSVNK